MHQPSSLIVCLLLLPAATVHASEKVVLTAEQSTGGKIVTLPDRTKGVTIDASCELPWPKVTAITWKSPAPMPAGWWRGTVELGKRDKDDLGWAQVTFGVVLLSPQQPLVSAMDNFRLPPLPPGQNQYSAPGPFPFQFWIYSAFPAEGVSIRPVYSPIWKYKRQWPVVQVVMERAEAPALSPDEPIALDLPVEANGKAGLPQDLPAGLWQMELREKCEGQAKLEDAEGRAIQSPFKTSWGGTSWGGGAFLWLDAPLRTVALTGTPIKGLALSNRLIGKGDPLPSSYSLMQTVDPARPQTAQLELLGAKLTGEPPVLPLLPMGRKLAVVTSWDDGQEWDLRLAEVLKRLKMRGTFHLNANSPCIQTLDKLEALGGEIGSHCFTHCFLFQLPPPRAAHECAAMRELLEGKLNHPVISFAYPNGYSKAYDGQGDYVLRAVKAAGYWSGRTTAVATTTIETIDEPAALATDGFFGEDQRGLLHQWELARAKDGAVFHVWGHSWQLGKTDEQWTKVEENLAKFAGQPDAWYATQGEVAIWRWLRNNIRLAVTDKSTSKMTVTLTRPWLHPYLCAQCPVSLKVPAGVERAIWLGKEVPVSSGYVELAWPRQ